MRAALATVAICSTLAALFFARPHATPGPPMRDFEAYYAAGRVQLQGGNPYGRPIWAAESRLRGVQAKRYEVLPFVGPPVTLPLFATIARLPFGIANMLWRSVLIVSLAALALLALRVASIAFSISSVILIAVAALAFGPLTSALALGQVALPAFLFCALALIWPASALLGWIQPNIALSTLSLRVGVPAAVLFAIANLVLAGPSSLLRYAQVLAAQSRAEQFSVIQITPASIAYGFGASPAAAQTIGVCVALAAASLWLALMLRVKEPLARFCTTCALLPFVAGFVHEHDLLVLFVPAIVSCMRADERRRPLALLAAMLCATDWLGLAQRPGGLLQSVLLAGSFGCAMIALRAYPKPRMLLVPGAVLALIVLAGFVAQAHPAPVWPDAMRTLPENIRALSVASAWHTEQAATGLLARNGFWALLRCLSLIGAAILVYVVSAPRLRPAAEPGLSRDEAMGQAD